MSPFLQDDRDFALGLLAHDYEAQLRAIGGMLRLGKQQSEAFDRELRGIEEFAKSAQGSASIQADNERVDHLHDGVYTDAAHSMAAVGMLAPFIESVFHQSFLHIKVLLEERRKALLPRRMVAGIDPWDCHFVSGSKKQNLVRGIAELSTAIGLTAYLPADFEKTLEALFGYRNKMFHHGFEWPMAERDKFQNRIAGKGWPPEWFEKSESGHQPWIFYMSRDLIDHCLLLVDDILKGVGAVARKNL